MKAIVPAALLLIWRARQLKAEEQFDAVLYLGPPSSIVMNDVGA